LPSGIGMELSSHPWSESHNLFSCFDLSQPVSELQIQSCTVPENGTLISEPGGQPNHYGVHLHVLGFFQTLDHLSRRAISAFPSGTQSKAKWSETRKMALARDGYRCRNVECGRTGPLTVHHIHPRGLGGGHQLSNLVTLCESCHQNLCTQCQRPAHLRVPLGDAAMKFPGVFAFGDTLPGMVIREREEKNSAVIAEYSLS